MLWRHSVIYLLAQGLPGLINLGAISIYSRLLEADEYGRYVLIIACVGLGNKLLFEWIRLALLRFLATAGQRAEVVRSTLATCFAALLAVVVLAGVVGAVLIEPAHLRPLWAGAFGLLCAQALFDLHLTLARSRLAPRVYGVMAISKAALALLLGTGLASIGLGALGLVLGLTAGMLIAVSPALLSELRGLRLGLCQWGVLRDLVHYGAPLAVTAASGFLLDSADRFLIGWLIDDDSLGRYGAAYELGSISIGMLLMVVNLAAYPLVIRAFEQGDPRKTRRELSGNLTALLAIGLPATLGMVLLAEPIANVILGPPFRQDAVVLMPLIAIGALMRDIKAYYLDLAFQLGRRTIGQVWVTVAALVANVLLNLWWLPRFGIAGAAYATIAAYGLAIVLSAVLGRRILALPGPGADSVKIVVATLTMGFIVWHVAGASGSALVLGQTLLTGVVSYGVLIVALDVAGARNHLLDALGWRVRDERGG